MADYSIKDLEQLSQVKSHTIRIWEKRYGLLKPRRSDTNIRSYSDDDLRKLLNVAFLSQRGMKVSRIAALSDGELSAEVLRSGGGADPAGSLEELVLAMMDLDQERFERIISHAVLVSGFEQCMFKLLIPFLGRLGVLWQAGAVHPGQEHFVSQIIRQKLLAAIDGIAPPTRQGARTLIFFLPEGEWHELGLLFGSYIARKAGHRVFYLGQSVPLKDVEAIAARHKPDALVTAVLTQRDERILQRMLTDIARTAPQARVMAHVPTGAIPEDLRQRVEVLGGLDHLAEALEK